MLAHKLVVRCKALAVLTCLVQISCMAACMQEVERTVSLQRNSLKAGQPPGSPLFGAEPPEDDDADAQEVEMVLETYFMHIDNTYNKLQTLTEYIDDTEVGLPTSNVSHC